MQLAFYKGPAAGLVPSIVHWATCVFTLSRYSHVELVIDGVCYSSSARDGGVRAKRIDLASGHWDVVALPADFRDEAKALAWFRTRLGQHYDWAGVLRFVPLLRWLPREPRQWFCSEAVAAALGFPNPDTWTPADLSEVAMELFE